jgi:Sporulation lipoprotein YhcN/YlaJ (Spore_YhcN_YlaJ)
VKIMKRNFACVQLVFLAFLFLLAACNVGGRPIQPTPSPTGQPAPTRIGNNLNERNFGPGGTTVEQDRGAPLATPMPGTQRLEKDRTSPAPSIPAPANDNQMEDLIRYHLAQMPDIQNVDVLVNGSRALIAYTRTNHARDAATMHGAINDKVRQIDSSITEVKTSISPEVRQEIGNMKRNLGINQPSDNMTDGFNRLFNQVAPPVK